MVGAVVLPSRHIHEYTPAINLTYSNIAAHIAPCSARGQDMAWNNRAVGCSMQQEPPIKAASVSGSTTLDFDQYSVFCSSIRALCTWHTVLQQHPNWTQLYWLFSVTVIKAALNRPCAKFTIKQNDGQVHGRQQCRPGPAQQNYERKAAADRSE
jgi:hypothetical protein